MTVEGFNLPEEASDNMLEKADSLLFNELSDHIAQDGTHSIESLIGSADICKADIVKQDLLNYENGDRFAELGTSFHDAEAEWDDLGGQQEVDHVGGVILHQRADDS